MFSHRIAIVACICLVCLLAGCASYATPGRGADLSAVGVDAATRKYLTDDALQNTLDKKPLAQFPTGIAVARIQSPCYQSRTAEGYGNGRYSVILTRDVETDAQIERLAKMPLVHGIAPMNRLLLSANLDSDLPLRDAAAKLHADMLLIYTFDTTFRENQMVEPLSTVTLGLSPTKNVTVVTTASAVLMDTRNGYIYGLAEGSAKRERLTSAWMSEDTIDLARQKNEREAFEKLVGEFEKTWSGVINQYAVRTTPSDASPASPRYETAKPE